MLRLLLLAAAPALAADTLPPLPGMAGMRGPDPVLVSTQAPVEVPVVTTATVTAPPQVAAAPAGLMPPARPVRAKNSLDSAVDVAKDLLLCAEYFESGQAYYRAYTKGGTHTAEENAAFVKFLEEYEQELAVSKRVHAALGAWLEKKSSVKD
jgi:hypothetical protein